MLFNRILRNLLRSMHRALDPNLSKKNTGKRRCSSSMFSLCEGDGDVPTVGQVQGAGWAAAAGQPEQSHF